MRRRSVGSRSVAARAHVPLLLSLAVAAASCTDTLEQTDELVLEAMAPIGLDVHEGPAAFGDIVDLELGEDGSIFVLDQLNRAVQVFRPDGTHVRTIGRQGSGPGEFENASALAWSPNGDLWVVDPASRRYSVFGPGGALVSTYVRPLGGIVLPWPGGFSESGLLYDVTFELGPDGPAMWLVEFEVGETDLAERNRFALPSSDAETFVYEDARVGLALPVPHTSRGLARVGPDGSLWLTDTGDPWVHRQTLGTGEILTLGTEFEPPPVTEADRRAALETEDARELRALGGAGLVAQFTARIPDTKPHLSGFFVDDVGRAWLMRSVTGPPARTPARLDVYDTDGQSVGSAEGTILPEPWPRVRNGVLAGVARDDLGVEFVVRYRVAGSD